MKLEGGKLRVFATSHRRRFGKACLSLQTAKGNEHSEDDRSSNIRLASFEAEEQGTESPETHPDSTSAGRGTTILMLLGRRARFLEYMEANNLSILYGLKHFKSFLREEQARYR